MDWKKFAGPAILIGIAILLYVGMNAYGDAKYDEGDTIEDGDMIAICGTYLLLVLLCLGSIVWFAFALGGKTQKTVFLAEDSSNLQHSSTPLVSNSQSMVVPSTIGGAPVSYVREKIIIAKSESYIPKPLHKIEPSEITEGGEIGGDGLEASREALIETCVVHLHDRVAGDRHHR